MVMAETSTFGILHGRNVRGRNALAEMSVAETSVAEISYIRPGIFRSTSAFFRSLTTAGDNRDRCQDTRLGQQSNLAHDRLLKFMALICGFV